ncbi:MAG: hypothetical protein K8I60_16660 [Anaerolineae bacterium]|nr:hypothetical protein [Anaerolineae bacterium]
MRSYRPSGSISAGGFLLMLIIGVIVAAIVGGILWAVDSYLHLYLVFAFPLFAGAIVGAVLVQIVKTTKTQSPIMAGLIGIIAGVVMYGAYHGASYYITFRGDLRTTYTEQNRGKPPTDEQLDQFINLGLMDVVGDSGFVGYLKLAAEVGFTITRTTSSSSSSGIEIKDTWAFVYWAAEVVLAGLTAGGMAWGAASQPFDENTNAWFSSTPEVVAIASNKNRKQLLRALKDGDFQGAGALLTREQIKYPRVEVWTRRSPDAAAQDVLLVLKVVQRNKRANNLKEGMVSVSELNTMLKAIDVPPTPSPVISNL